jgi:hypothetical protein
LGSCGTSLPSKARFKMLCRRQAARGKIGSNDKKLGTVPERWGREMLWGCRRRRRIRLLNRTCCANLPRRSISFSNLDVILRWWRYAYHRLMASIPPGSGARDGQVAWSLSQNSGTVPEFFLFTIGGSAPGAFRLVLGLGELCAFAVNLGRLSIARFEQNSGTVPEFFRQKW